jgi:hypothetical protein
MLTTRPPKPSRHRCKWEDDIKMGRLAVVWEDTDWFELAEVWDRWREFLNAVMNFQVS